MKTILAYPLSVIYYFFFSFFLLVFHPIQWICLKIGGSKLHWKSIIALNFCLTRCLYILGSRITFINKQNLQKGQSYIFVSNHQDIHDITGITWYLRKFYPRFVSKKELGKGIPSVSFNLKYGNNALIDRKNPKQALPELKRFGKVVEDNKFSAVIFPEGTRSKTGKVKRFSENGVKMLTRFIPSAQIVPISINNNWKLTKNGNFPLEIGVHFKFEVHEPMDPKSGSFEEIFEKTELTVKNSVTL